MPPPPSSTLLPYTTLFRSRDSCSDCPGRPELTGSARTHRASAECQRARASGLARYETCRRDPTATARAADAAAAAFHVPSRSEEHTSELQSLRHLVCRLLL